MMLLNGFRRASLRLLAAVMIGVTAPAWSADAPAPATNAPVRAAEDSAEAQRALRSYLQLQEQLHATMLAIEQTRLENSLASRTNADALATRLELIEKSLDQQRQQHADAMRNSNRTLLTLAGVFMGVGFLTLLVMAFFQLRGMNRLAEIATGFPTVPGLTPAALANGTDPRLLGPGGNGESTRLHGVIERLERRIHELEGAARPGAAATIEVSATNGERKQGAVEPSASHSGHVTVLLGKGQALLQLGQHEGALRCFDEAIAAAPDHAEAHVRRGQALERLKRVDEAVACYDRAIALDRSLTQAYLCKGGAFNQQERYSEALECYEQALRSESPAAAP